ncbi:unnamed protein product [Symbiodinium natans]|uniref:Transmembrane protein n=1 Tax=Symbiodinium natans TaxID=878477 RepID=A0A812TI96_9DINO|nr:unnamed protein product [Symbiodinium natans]
MDRLRRPESFDDVHAEGLFRGTTALQILQNRGIIFAHGLEGLLGAGGFRPQKIPTKQEVLEAGARIFDNTSCAEHVNVFVSHCWGSKRWAKYLALCLYLNFTAAVVCALGTWVAAVTVMLVFGGNFATSHRFNLLSFSIVVYLPTAVFFVVFFLGHHVLHRFRPISLWVDRACVHQTDDELKRRQIQALPVFVARSSSMLVLWDDSYFQRLWCQLELATFAKYGGAAKVQFQPLWLAPWLLSALALDLAVATSWNIIFYWVPKATLTSTSSAVLPTLVLESPFAPLVEGMVFTTTNAIALGVLASIPWTYSCKKKLRNHALMLEQMAAFDCRAAQCTVEADRILVELQVRQLFSSPEKEDEADLTSSSHPLSPRSLPSVHGVSSCDSRALDDFNAFIRGPLRSTVLESVGGEMHVPYGMCLSASLPMIFWSVSDILQYCHCGVGDGLRSCAAPLIIGWVINILLVLPIVYPVFLRMLKCALAVRSEWLQLILSALSGIVTFCHSSNCQGVAFVLPTLGVQDTATRWVGFTFLAFLLLQISCLFGNSGILPAPAAAPETGNDGTYRRLHTADT